ncbi:MAG: hypothetical protein KDC48_13625, partial [Planctomycetes bacterium]|nr:hypothetical protein [Planctomycetota bacterium]
DLGDVTVRAYAKFDIDFDGFGDGGGVYLYLLDGPARPGQRMDDTFVSPQNGRRSTVLLHPGRYAAVARSKDGVVVRTIDTAAVEGQVLRFDCVRGANLHLVSERQLVLPLDVSIEGPGGALVWRRDLSGRVDTNVELPAGDYRATITNEGGAVTHRAVHLGSDGATITLP